MSQQHDYDLIIVGGGMVGATLACALGGGPLRIAVLEGHESDFHWPLQEYEIRVSAITRATQNVFANIGAWEAMAAMRVSPYEGMRVWDATGSGEIAFDAAEIGEPDLGLIVENGVILAALRERMAQFDNIELLCPVRGESLVVHEHAAHLRLADGRELSARLVVGADGAESWVRGQAGIETVGWPYDQHAVVATITHSLSHQRTAWQRFMPDGPLAFLPLPEEDKCSIVWSTSPEHAAELAEMEKSAFLDELQNSFGDRLGRMLEVGPRGVFPLQLKHARAYCAPRLVLVGNAAHAIHPLAGQGLNLGVSDVAELAELLDTRAAERGGDIGDLALLRRYERARKGENLAVMGAMEGFKRLFGNDNGPLRLVRNLGLKLTNAATPVKNRIIRQAMGLDGSRPPLARRAL